MNRVSVCFIPKAMSTKHRLNRMVSMQLTSKLYSFSLLNNGLIVKGKNLFSYNTLHKISIFKNKIKRTSIFQGIDINRFFYIRLYTIFGSVGHK